MPFASLHDQMEVLAPDGVGFAIHNDFVGRLIAKVVRSTTSDPSFHTDIPLGPVANVSFSFDIDPASVTLDTAWNLTMNVRVTLHPRARSNDAIVTIDYTVTANGLTPLFDPSRGSFSWTLANAGAPAVNQETWEPTDAVLTGLGYANRDDFKNKVFYGFEWVNSTNLVDTIVRVVPFPQLQKNFGLFELHGPFHSSVIDEYIAVWTEDVTFIGGPCDQPQPSQRPAPAIHGNPAPGPKSRFENSGPQLVLFGGASKLASWYAERFAPAIAVSDSGGGFVKWSVDGALALRSLELWLSPSATGGMLEVKAGLRLFAQGNSWIDGPCGSRLSLLSGTIEANGNADVHIIASLDWNALEIDLDIDVNAAVDPGSVHVTGGGLLGPIVGQIAELLVHASPNLVAAAYHKRTRAELFNLHDLGIGRMKVAQRVGDASIAVALLPDG